MQDRLNLIFDTLEQWRECQRNWLYLENIFSSQDIRKQRPKDYQEYDVVNKSWIKLMKQVVVKRGVRQQCGASTQRYHELVKWNRTMESVQKNLEDYLEEKREQFPRFYFISNDELLQILANSADLRAIEKHASKCFENLQAFVLQDEIVREKQMEREAKRLQELERLRKLDEAAAYDSRKSGAAADEVTPLSVPEPGAAARQALPEEEDLLEDEQFDGSDLSDIFGIKSGQEEKLKFGRILKVRGQGVEIWMRLLEECMVAALQKCIRVAYSKYYDDLAQDNGRKGWVLKHLAQAVAIVDLVTWTEGTEMALNDLLDGNPFAMEDHLEIMREQLAELTELIRGSLTSIQRKSLVALITQDVHCRDIVEKLHLESVASPFHFIWQQQLRYAIEDDQVFIRQVNALVNYGYEYMGPTSRLVITPLTDKCWITITGAMHIKLGAAPAGPAGTGKTESTKDLAKACGIFCIVINCSEQIEYRMMAKLFSGLVQSGAWSCLDEFNRINIEVLSVIAQQLLDIKQAKVMGKETFFFNEQERVLKPQCGVFITMNPGYAGRTELPDNLKVLFRPVSMMIPNYGLIAEIMLFAEGFSEAQALSTKMVQLYKLASEQLSQQDHYDFGLRAVKSVLVMAGNLKRAHPELPENIVLIRAMRDSNIPKFLASDLPLFSALIQDLFPAVEIPETQHSELEAQIKRTLASMSLQSVEKQTQKVIQLFETLNVRFGVMVVGPTGGGKTTTLNVLADAMTQLRLQLDSKDSRFQVVKKKVLNPKSISMGELYGEENADTQEWTDGLASKILRKFAQAQGSQRKSWCVFDGPVDALWIENMNTVLDDNMTLCLVNGERIKLNHDIRILFEVQDLAQASPATVSRCGMVYITPSDLGWRPYFDSWVQNYMSRFLRTDQLEFLTGLFEMFVDLGFEKLLRLRDQEVMPTYASQNVQCLCNFMEHFIKDARLQQEDKTLQWQKQINSAFAFAMIWGFGSAFESSAHRHLDSVFRDFFGKLHIPPKETVFQYFYHEKEMRFKSWAQLLPDFETRIVAPYDQLFVPTIDSVSYTKVLSYLTSANKKTFLTGSTGVGKSVIVQEYIQQSQEREGYAPVFLNFSAQTSSASVQKSIESKLTKKRGKKVIGAKGGQQCLIFIDDINMPKVEQYGAQPPVEFLRLLLDGGVIYDRPQFFKKVIENYRFVCAAAPPGGGRAALTPRFMRHFHIVCIPNASEEILTSIFDTILTEFLAKNMFADGVRKCGNIAVAATIDMFTQFNKHMLPIPSRFHYLFNMRDVTKVFQGILMTQPQSIVDSKAFTRLWLHECQRVFHDRLINEADRQFFKDLAQELLKTKFKETWSQEELFTTDHAQNRLKVTFSMILKCDYEEKLYEQNEDPRRLVKLLEDKMLDYNYTFTQKPMSLIFFEDAIDHICRIARILHQPRGNAMLIGVSGSGKQSLTKLASFLHEAECSQIKLTKTYKPQNFRDDIKQMLLQSGCERKPHVFLLADTQIAHEEFLEDTNCILNTGEIADLYDKEDFDRMEVSLQKVMKDRRIPTSKDNIYATFVKELRLHFHIILCMSPVGDLLRIRCRNFPSLVNCCTLDWFDNWPEEALRTVSQQFFKANAVVEDDEALREAIAGMFPVVHRSAQDLALRFYEDQRRRVYITPKTYLDALSLFRQQLDGKQRELETSLGRLQNGIRKLEATNKQIAELQVTLTNLVPKLLEENQSAEQQAAQI
jgi:dynein heavy chain, axonemal